MSTTGSFVSRKTEKRQEMKTKAYYNKIDLTKVSICVLPIKIEYYTYYL